MKRWPKPSDLITAFLQAFAPERLCGNCLAARLGIDVYAVRETVRSLTERPPFVVASGRCSGCGRRAKTIGYDTAAVEQLSACRLCEQPLDGDRDLVFPEDGGVVHRACFVRARDEQGLGGGSDLGVLSASAGSWTSLFDGARSPDIVTVERHQHAVAWSRGIVAVARMTRARSRAVRNVSRVVSRRAGELRSRGANAVIPRTETSDDA